MTSATDPVIESPLLARPAVRWVVGSLVVILLAIANLPWQLDDYDQAKQAFTSFEMVQQGHWLYQHTPNGWVATKPPLAGWMSAGIFLITRSWEFAWRMPSFLAVLALLLLLYRGAARAYGEFAGLIAGAAFGLNMFTLRLATLVRTDMLFTLILFLIGWQIWEKVRHREGWNSRDRFVTFALLAAALFIKGPIVYAFFLPALIAFQWRARATGEQASAWCGWWPWLAPLLLLGAWAAGGILFVPEFSAHVMEREFAGRFGEGWHRPQPFYFYVPHLLHRFAPWSLLLILFTVLALRTKAANLHTMAPETFWLLVWAASGLLLLSFIPSKRIDRIFPMVPPLCLLLATQAGALLNNARLRRTAAVACQAALLVSSVGLSVYAVLKVTDGYRNHREAYVTFGESVRAEAARRQLRYAAVGGEDEGMALYLRRTEFLEVDQAVAQWNSHKVDALVVAEEELAELMPRLPGAQPSALGLSGPAGSGRRRYVFLVRS